jgi:SAM-dependent methyltransferase
VIGPAPALAGQDLSDGVRSLASLEKDRSDWDRMLETAATLYTLGATIDWVGFDHDYARRKVALPTYPFERKRYWIDSIDAADSRHAASSTFEQSVEAGHRAAAEGPLDLALHTYPVKWDCSERLTIAYMIAALRGLGCFTSAGDVYTVDSLVDRCAILPGYRKLIARWLDTLASQGLLRRDDARFMSPEPLQQPPLKPLIAAMKAAFSECPPIAAYLIGCGTALVEVLTGKESALETLFPRGSFEIADALYRSCPAARYMNGIVRKIVESFVKAIPAGRTIRILEIGAGTGSTAAELLPLLPTSRSIYYFTDVSDLFLARAEERFREYPFVRYGLLDAERDPQEQGYRAGAFDLIVSVNALHATRNLETTIDHARSLLRPGGMLLLSESTAHPISFDVTVGLIEGWQLFEDPWRQDNPLLPPAVWCDVLRSRGFERAVALPDAGSPAETLGQSVLVALSPVAEEGWDTRREIRLDTPAAIPARRAASPTPAAAGDGLVQRLEEAIPAEREELLVSYVRDHVARVLRLDAAGAPSRRQRLMDVGLDSLMAVELRNRLRSGLGSDVNLPATLMFDYPTIEAIAVYLGRCVIAAESPAVAIETGNGNGHLDEAAARLAGLSEEDVEALLIQRLESL